MHSFTQRSYQKELLDGPAIPFEAIRQNMQELNTINTYLGGHRITQAGFCKLLPYIDTGDVVRVVEVGCGGGDNLRAIQRIAAKVGRQVQLTGIDINPECIAFAKSQAVNKGIHFICSDYKEVAFEQRPHMLFSSLFCHHFTNEELHGMLRWLYQHSTVGFFINDLHRHPVAYYAIKSLTALFSKSYLVKNDAPLSVRRSFTKKDWHQLLQSSHITAYRIQWKWAFRWLVIVTK